MREKLLEALESSDARRRTGRAERIEWLSLHQRTPPIYAGRTETLQVFHEARDTFVDGYYVGSLLLALAFLEHTIIEELRLLGHTKGFPSFAQAIELARERKVFPEDWLKRAKALSHRRNAYCHPQDDEHALSLGNRIRLEDRHPTAIMEADAKKALELMYDLFVATLREHPG